MFRESIEWTNGWRDDADVPKKRRWLVIGDSVAREWRGRLKELVAASNIAVDFFASSLHIEDPAFFKEPPRLVKTADIARTAARIADNDNAAKLVKHGTGPRIIGRKRRNMFQQFFHKRTSNALSSLSNSSFTP